MHRADPLTSDVGFHAVGRDGSEQDSRQSGLRHAVADGEPCLVEACPGDVLDRCAARGVEEPVDVEHDASAGKQPGEGSEDCCLAEAEAPVTTKSGCNEAASSRLPHVGQTATPRSGFIGVGCSHDWQ